MIALVVSFAEVFSHDVGKYLQSRNILYSSLEVDSSDYADYLARRDPVLGWPPQSNLPRTVATRPVLGISPTFATRETIA